MASRERVIEVKGVTKSFGENHVLRGVDLHLERAENVAVLGRSGSGKSILIKMMVGLLHPDAGEVIVLGQSVPDLRKRELDALRIRIGFLFQSGALYDSMSVGENLAFPLQMNHPAHTRAELDRKIDEALDAVGLIHKRYSLPAQLSGGEKKRVGIARTLILQPELMLYDEPTAGLDPITAGEINQLILDVRQRYQTSAIVITHDLSCAKTTADRIAILLDGQTSLVGSFDTVFANPDPRVQGFYEYTFPKGAST